MTFYETRETLPRVFPYVIITLPYLIFYWMLPFIADYSIGQDYQTIGIQSQMELFFSIKTGSFPLYVPGFAYGNPSSALTLGQLYHPIAYIASILPGYWNGKALEWNTFLRLMSLGLTHLVLFQFLRKIKLSTMFSFLLSFITVYNLRMIDLFRYGASLEAYTGHLLLCAVIGWYFIKPSGWLKPISIIGLTYWLVCSGHAQMMYYGLLGTGLCTLVMPFFVSTMMPDHQIDSKVITAFWLKCAGCLLLGILLSSAYILPFYFDFMATNAERVGQSYEWSTAYGDTLMGTLNSFFLPFRSDVHGSFGGSSFILIAAILPLLRLFRVKVPGSIWISWGLLLLFFLYLQGERTPLHKLAWEYLPFASSFRTPGRISLIIPIFSMMILAWLVKAGQFKLHIKGRSFAVTPLTALSAAAVVVTVIYLTLLATSLFSQSSFMKQLGHFTPAGLRDIPRPVEVFVILAGLFSLISLALYESRLDKHRWLEIILCLAVLIHVGLILKFGTWITEKQDKPTFEQMIAQKKEKLEYRHHPGSGLYSTVVSTQIKQSFMEPFMGKVYYDIIPVSGQKEAYEMMHTNRLPQQVFIESVEPTGEDHTYPETVNVNDRTVDLVYSSFNRLQFMVHSKSDGYFGFSFPYTGHWSAQLNGDTVPLFRANGAAHAVGIPSGDSLLEFRYWSAAANAGMIISVASFAFTGAFISLRSMRIFGGAMVALIVIIISAGGYILWYNSLYNGNNLGTDYVWVYKSPASSPNIAYGKKTSLSSYLSGGYFLLKFSSRAIDGDKSPNSGFSTSTEKNPFIIIDLKKAQKIGSLAVYESYNDETTNVRPLKLTHSMDNEHWHTVDPVINQKNIDGRITINFTENLSARFIKIQGTGYSKLQLDEVEIYGPEISN